MDGDESFLPKYTQVLTALLKIIGKWLLEQQNNRTESHK